MRRDRNLGNVHGNTTLVSITEKKRNEKLHYCPVNHDKTLPNWAIFSQCGYFCIIIDTIGTGRIIIFAFEPGNTQVES